MGLVAGNNIKTTLIGDKSLSGRPMKRVSSHLEKSGAIINLRKNLYPPIEVMGSPNLIPLSYNIDIPQPKLKVLLCYLHSIQMV